MPVSATQIRAESHTAKELQEQNIFAPFYWLFVSHDKSYILRWLVLMDDPDNRNKDSTIFFLKVFGYTTPVVILLALWVGYSFF